MLGVVNADGSIASGFLTDDIIREGARRMLAAALETEASRYIAELAPETNERGRHLVVCNGHHRPRTVVTAACWTATRSRQERSTGSRTGKPRR